MQKNEITLVIGASENPERYSNRAAKNLVARGYLVKLLGNKTGKINNDQIEVGFPDFKNIHTVTIYLNPTRQIPYYQYILDLKPKRVLFNPGTENPEFLNLLLSHNIAAEEACTLVLLSINDY